MLPPGFDAGFDAFAEPAEEDDEPLCSLGGPSFAFTPPSDFINPPLDKSKAVVPGGPDCSDPTSTSFWMDMCLNLDSSDSPPQDASWA